MTHMKHYMLLALALIATATAHAAAESDTIVYASAVDSVTVMESKGSTHIILSGINGSAENITYVLPKPDGAVVRTHNEPKEKEDKMAEFLNKVDKNINRASGSKWSVAIGGLGFGWNMALDKNPAGMQLRANQSWDITWLYALGVKYSIKALRADLSLGLGFDWKNYKMASEPWFVPGDGKQVGLGDMPAGTVAHSSRLKVFSLSVPLVYRQSLGFKLPACGTPVRLAVGPVLNFNTHGSLLNKYTRADGVEMEQSTNHIGQKKVTVDVYGGLFLNSWLGIYVKYSPMNVLDKGPQFKSWTMGVSLAW